jgi:hypothetical protein
MVGVYRAQVDDRFPGWIGNGAEACGMTLLQASAAHYRFPPGFVLFWAELQVGREEKTDAIHRLQVGGFIGDRL